MKYCVNCGTKIGDNNKFCTNCGLKISFDEEINNIQKNGLKSVSIVLGIVGIIGGSLIVFSPFSFIICFLGLIFAIISSKKVKNAVGIILNVIGLFISVIALILFIFIDNLSDDDFYDRFDDNKYSEYY